MGTFDHLGPAENPKMRYTTTGQSLATSQPGQVYPLRSGAAVALRAGRRATRAVQLAQWRAYACFSSPS